MSRSDKYPFANATRKVCTLLKITPERVLRRAGLPPDALEHEGRGIDAERYFALWNAVMAEAGRPDLPLVLGQATARAPWETAVFAFSCSPDIETGLERLSLFKSLIAPVVLGLERDENALRITFTSADPDTPMPESMAAFELVYFVEIARTFTGEHVVPGSAGLPTELDWQTDLEAHLGVSVEVAGRPHLVLSDAEARLPLVSENADLWAGLEPDLRRRLVERDRDAPMTARVKHALLTLLPGGQSTAEAVCDHLHISKRSLHRRLRDEGRTFQSILDATRTELSMHYLSNDDLSIEEISYLLAFRDQSSFYRAFRGWTGMTPREARGRRAH